MTERSITIKDIAEKASVSISTVSRVLNGNAPVAESTRQRIMEIIDELGYKPNLFAQGLAGGQSRTIGILTQLIGSPFFDVILRGILKGINGSGYSPLFADGGWNSAKDEAAIQTFMQRQVDGLIVLSGSTSDQYLQEVSRQIPLIMIGRKIPDLLDRCLVFNDFDDAKTATQFLIQAGHRRIAHISGLVDHIDAIERRSGYLEALKEAGIPQNPDLIVEGDFTEPSGMMAVEMLLSRGMSFSAIFAANDQMAYGARLALYRRGLRVPEDVSLVGFDDQAPSAYMIPPLTTIRRPPLEIGEQAGAAMIQLIQGKPIQLSGCESTLVMRESVNRRL